MLDSILWGGSVVTERETNTAYNINLTSILNRIFIKPVSIPIGIQMLPPGPSEGLVGVLLAQTIQFNVGFPKHGTQELYIMYPDCFDVAQRDFQILTDGVIRGRICEPYLYQSKWILIQMGR